MATTLDPARPSPGAGKYPLDPGRFDEAFAPGGTPRPPYAAVLDALARHDLAVLRERVQSAAAALGLEFGPGQPLTVDPVPRLIDAGEWDGAGGRPAAARARPSTPSSLDAYGGQRIFDAGVVPRRLLETSSGYEPRMRGLLDPDAAAGDRGRPRPGQGCGRRPAGSGGQSEDALRSRLRARRARSGRAGARRAAAPAAAGLLRRRAGCRDPRAPPPTAATSRRRRSSPTDPRAAPGTSTAGSGASWGSRWCEPHQLETERGRLFARDSRERRQLDVLYRRLDEDRLSAPDGGLTALGELLLPALESGRLRCVNAFGSGLADDKLAHAYVESMVRFYLGEEPLLRSVPSFDLSDRARPRGRRWSGSRSW